MADVRHALTRIDSRLRRSGWVIWTVGAGAYFLGSLHRASLGVAGPQAQERLDLGAAQLGFFVMLQLGIYALMQVPAGLLIDRWGPRRVLLGATVIMGVAQTIFAFATNYPIALSARALLGVGDAAVYISLLRLAASWFPARRYAVLTMWSGLVGMAGQLAATVPLTLALDSFGWVRTFAVTGITSIVYALLLLRPAVAAPYREATAVGRQPGVSGVLADVAAVWRGTALGKGTQLGFWTHQMTMSPSTVLSMVWGFPYLTEGLGYSPTEAAGQLSLLVVGVLVFNLIIPPFAGRRRGARMPLALVTGGANLLAFVLLLGWPGGHPPPVIVTVALVMLSAGAPASQIGFHLARDYNPPERMSTATGLVNAGGFLGAMVGAVTVGIVLDALSGTAAPTLTDYRWALASLGLITAFSVTMSVGMLLSVRRHALGRAERGEPVVVPVVPHWWDRP